MIMCIYIYMYAIQYSIYRVWTIPKYRMNSQGLLDLQEWDMIFMPFWYSWKSFTGMTGPHLGTRFWCWALQFSLTVGLTQNQNQNDLP